MSQKMKYLSIALSLVLAACSGGGGGGDATAPSETTTTEVSTSSTTTTTPVAEPTTGFGFVTNPAGGNYGYNCIKDYATGLIWEGKEPANSSLRFYGRRYTNFDNINVYQDISVGGATYLKPTQAQVDAPTNSVGYKNAVNATALCGFTDWRIPTSEEIESLKTGFSSSSPSIDTAWFPFTTSGYYISSTSEGASTLPSGEIIDLLTYRSLFSAGGGGDSYARRSSDELRLVR